MCIHMYHCCAYIALALLQFDLETFQDTQTDLRWLAGKSHKGRRKEKPEKEEIDFGKKDDAAEMEKLKVGRGGGRALEGFRTCLHRVCVWMAYIQYKGLK